MKGGSTKFRVSFLSKFRSFSTKIPREDPQREREKERKLGAGEGKKHEILNGPAEEEGSCGGLSCGGLSGRGCRVGAARVGAFRGGWNAIIRGTASAQASSAKLSWSDVVWPKFVCSGLFGCVRGVRACSLGCVWCGVLSGVCGVRSGGVWCSFGRWCGVHSGGREGRFFLGGRGVGGRRGEEGGVFGRVFGVFRCRQATHAPHEEGPWWVLKSAQNHPREARTCISCATASLRDDPNRDKHFFQKKTNFRVRRKGGEGWSGGRGQFGEGCSRSEPTHRDIGTHTP